MSPRPRCQAQTTSRNRRGQCRMPAAPGHAVCFLHGAKVTPGTVAPYTVSADGLVSLRHLWYRSERVVSFVTERLDGDEISKWLLGHEDRYSRRWYALREEIAYERLTTVDELFVYLDLRLVELGEPDIASSLPPAYQDTAEARPCAA